MLKRIKYFKDRNFTLQELTEISKLLLPAEFKKGSIIFDQRKYIYIYIICRKSWVRILHYSNWRSIGRDSRKGREWKLSGNRPIRNRI